MYLRELVETDLPIFFEYQREPEANDMAAFPARDAEAFRVHFQGKVLNNPDVKVKAIIEGDDVVGHVLSWTRDRQRLFGYWIGKKFWGRGLASLAAEEFLKNCDPFRPIFAQVAAHNKGSIRVLEKCGFQQVGAVNLGPLGQDEYLMVLHAK